MSRSKKTKSGSSLNVFDILLILLLLLGAGMYYYITNVQNLSSMKKASTPAIATPEASTSLDLPTEFPAGSSVSIESASSLATFNKRLGQAFIKRYPGVKYSWKTSSSLEAIQALIAGRADVAAIARPLTSREEALGLVAVPVKTDAIAILVGRQNPFKKGLTTEQLRNIFLGKVTNWSQLGGVRLPLRVINRPPSTGTYQTFQKAILGSRDFGNGPNWTTMERSGSTEVLQKLGVNGISYVNYSQIKTQKTIRALPLDGMIPGSPQYPLISVLYYVYSPTATEATKALITFATSPAGKAIAALE
jgi:phosphate transport system substrate-binding protein